MHKYTLETLSLRTMNMQDVRTITDHTQ